MAKQKLGAARKQFTHPDHRPTEPARITRWGVGRKRNMVRLTYEDGSTYDAYRELLREVPPDKTYSVMILYPEGSGEYGDTFYTFVNAPDRHAAVKEAIRECCMSNDWTLPDDEGLQAETGPDYQYEDFQELLVLDGQHQGI